jgi:succinoglycan biosynthesis protein ExoA
MHSDQNRYPERIGLTPQAKTYSPGESATLPAVSVVMPVLNEERHLAESVACVLDQEYPGGFELVLAIGPSRDRTEAIAKELAAADSRITVVANPSGQIATAMNAAVRTARHEIITRIDAHSMLPDGYLRTAVRTLMETGAADVGGWMAAEGITPFQRAVAWAMTSPFGMGAAANHTGGEAGPADTVYLGVYRRSEIERVGGYDETMLIAEDWELNYRIRAAGGLIWFTPDLKVTYRPRATLRELARQQFRYGRWRRVVARTGPRGGGAHRDTGRGTRTRSLPPCRAAGAGRVPGRDRRGRRGVRPRRSAPGADAGPAGARRDAHVLGRRVPHQPPPPGRPSRDPGRRPRVTRRRRIAVARDAPDALVGPRKRERRARR